MAFTQKDRVLYFGGFCTFMPQSIFSMSVLLFLIANPVGNVPVFVSLVKNFEFRQQRWILFRESLFSAFLAFAFLFVGEKFLSTFSIQPYTLKLCAGILIFLISLQMIFPPQEQQQGPNALPKEPYIVPIATPLISGGGVFATIVLLSKQASLFDVSMAITLTWTLVIAIVVSSVYLQKILGKRGLIVLEQLMGMLLVMLSISLFMSGLQIFIEQSPAHLSIPAQ